MGSRKRNRDEMELPESAPELSLLSKVRNTWELANLMQYIFFFGKAVKIDEDLTIEVCILLIGHYSRQRSIKGTETSMRWLLLMRGSI